MNMGNVSMDEKVKWKTENESQASISPGGKYKQSSRATNSPRLDREIGHRAPNGLRLERS